MRAIAAMLFLLGGCLFAQEPSKPQVSAFFDRIDDGPAIFVECLNTSGETLSSGAKRWTNALRIDGAVVPEPDSSIAAGPTRKVAAGETWRGILALRQSDHSYFPAVKFGAMVRTAGPLASSRLPKENTLLLCSVAKCGQTNSPSFGMVKSTPPIQCVNEFYQKGCQEKSSASTGVEI